MWPKFEYDQAVPPACQGGARNPARVLPLAERKGTWVDVSPTFTEWQAKAECLRCLRCDVKPDAGRQIPLTNYGETMIAPTKISLRIDGRLCEGTQGQSILEIAQANDIAIPTLCYLKGLTPWGGCRMCIVEIEGSPKVAPLCATPAVDGYKVITSSDRLHKLRRATLELLFSERNHICPTCP